MASVPNTTTSASPHGSPINVAIIGGGIGGLCLALGLLKHSHIDVHVYESAPTFGEIGAGVAFGPNAQRALELLGPAAHGAFLKQATPNMWATHTNTFIEHLVGKGDHEGETISAQKNATGMQSVHRAHFLDELVKGIPAQRAHFNKRLVAIEDEGDTITLRFKNGTTATADAVIGADGIHSTVREHLLGVGSSLVNPSFAGAVAYRGLVPMDTAVAKMGAEFAQNSMSICGPGKAFLSYPIDHGEISNIVLMDFEHPVWEHEKWIMPATYSQLAPSFVDWGRQAQGLLELFDTPDLAAWAMFDSPPAPFYNRGHVVMMGDAAHATTPFQGQGASQAIEDALVLETLLGKVSTVEQLPNAFAAYDQVRRPRSQKVVTTSRETGDLLGMKLKGVDGDLKKMREKFETRLNWIWHRNILAQNQEAVELFEESL
ncbi:MAG: hypothetical protein M1827_001019 [Pycnora praestabilis]|nr:MAG: hypothetical protein M1827_001019 [Pycnora praestabilis]